MCPGGFPPRWGVVVVRGGRQCPRGSPLSRGVSGAQGCRRCPGEGHRCLWGGGRQIMKKETCPWSSVSAGGSPMSGGVAGVWGRVGGLLVSGGGGGGSAYPQCPGGLQSSLSGGPSSFTEVLGIPSQLSASRGAESCSGSIIQSCKHSSILAFRHSGVPAIWHASSLACWKTGVPGAGIGPGPQRGCRQSGMLAVWLVG